MSNSRRLFATEHMVLSGCIFVLLIYLAPYVYYGTDATLLIHDNLDSSFAWYKVLLESGALFQDNNFAIQRINGLPRGTLPSEFDAMVPLYALFGPYGAYIVNRMLVAFIGFFGMYLLLRRYVVPGRQNRIIQSGAALCFAMLPFWPNHGLSSAGIPLVVYAFLNIRERAYNWYHWLILLLFPFYSSLVLSGFFLLVSLSLLWLLDLARRKASIHALLALLLLSVGYLFTHYRLVLDFLADDTFVSHRVEFAAFDYTGLTQALQNAWSMFRSSLYHVRSLHDFLIFPLVLGAGLFVIHNADRRTRNIFTIVAVFLVSTSLWYGFLSWGGIADVKKAVMTVFPMQLGRFGALHPTLWMVMFAITLGMILRESKSLRLLVLGILGLQILYQLSSHEIVANRNSPSIGAFFAENQFHAIRDHIDEEPSGYRVASLGIHPSIAQYNGFYTLDGYFINYPLSYKHAFRKVIAGELDKNDDLKEYFDNWGSRIYLFSSELKERGEYVMNRAGNDFEIARLDIDHHAFRALGGRYILAAVRINQDSNPGIRFLKAFKDPSSAWDIYLYSVDGHKGSGS